MERLKTALIACNKSQFAGKDGESRLESEVVISHLGEFEEEFGFFFFL